MNILLLLIPAALFLGLLGLAAFVWAMKNHQFDDLEGAAMRILVDDEIRPGEKRPGQDEDVTEQDRLTGEGADGKTTS